MIQREAQKGRHCLRRIHIFAGLNQVYEIQNIVQSVNDTTAQELTGTVMSRSGNTLTVRVTLHDNTNTILAATDPTGTINTGTVQLTPDASGNYIATQGIAVGGAANDVNTGTVQIAAAKVIISGDCTFISGYDPSTKLAVGAAAADVNAGSTTISGGKITTGSIDCNCLKTSTLQAITITLGVTGGNGIIRSSNYVAGSAGFQIDGAGNAEFSNVTVRGTIAACTLSSGSTLKVIGYIQSNNYASGSAGWQLTGVGNMEITNITINGDIIKVGQVAASGTISGQVLASASTVRLTGTIINPAALSIYTPNGLMLYWRDANGTDHNLF